MKWWCFNGPLLLLSIELFLLFGVGGFLLSHNLPVAVPSARAGLASGFGMGPGVSLLLLATDKHPRHSGRGCCVRYCVVDANTGSVNCVFIRVCVYSSKPFWWGLVCLFWSISTSRLNTLRCVQFWPINPIVFGGPNNETSS